MSKEQIRAQVIEIIRKQLQNEENSQDLNISVAQQYFFNRKTDFNKTASKENQKVAKKIFGVNYRCVSDRQQFQFSNNLKALTIILLQIAFQDDYTASILLSELKGGKEQLSKIQNFPLDNVVKSKDYHKVLIHTLNQLCDICEQNMDVAIRDILGAYFLGLEMLALIPRLILMKLNYLNGQDYQSNNIKEKTTEVFQRICEYLDINLIAKQKKGEAQDTSQVYLFTDFNLFIITNDNTEFLVGAYFDNEEQLKQAEGVRKSQMELLLKKSMKIDNDNNTKKSNMDFLKISNFQMDLGMSGSSFISPSQQESPYFNSNTPSPCFGNQYGLDSLKLRKSIDGDHLIRGSYFSIKEEEQPMEASFKKSIKQPTQINQNSFQLNQNSFQKLEFPNQNVLSIIMSPNGQSEELQPISPGKNKIQDLKDSKQPKSPPTLAGLAQLRFFRRTKNNNVQMSEKQQSPLKVYQSVNFTDQIIHNETEKKKQKKDKQIQLQFDFSQNFDFAKSDYIKIQKPGEGTPRDYILEQEKNVKNKAQYVVNKRIHRGSCNQVNYISNYNRLKNTKKSDITGNETIKGFETFSKREKDKIIGNIQRAGEKKLSEKSNLSQKSNYSYSKPKTIKQNKGGENNKSNFSSQCLYDKKMNHFKNEENNKVIKTQPNLHETHQTNNNKSQKSQKSRKYSHNRPINAFQFGSRSHNLKLSSNLPISPPDQKQQNFQVFNEDNLKSQKVEKKNIFHLIIPPKNNQIIENYNRVKSSNNFMNGKNKQKSVKKSPDTQRNNKPFEHDQINQNQNINKFGKFPEFLRKSKCVLKSNQQTQKILQQIKKNRIIGKINQLVILDKKKSPQPVYNSPREINSKQSIELKTKNGLTFESIQSELLLRKTKDTQSQPILIFSGELIDKDMSYSMMPETFDNHARETNSPKMSHNSSENIPYYNCDQMKKCCSANSVYNSNHMVNSIRVVAPPPVIARCNEKMLHQFRQQYNPSKYLTSQSYPINKGHYKQQHIKYHSPHSREIHHPQFNKCPSNYQQIPVKQQKRYL